MADLKRTLPVGYRLIPSFQRFLINEKGIILYPVRSMYSKIRWKKLSVYTYADGRKQVSMKRDGVSQRSSISWLVLEAFVGPRPPGMWALHRDDNKANNHVSNLRWGTPLENGRDAVRNGKRARGMDQHKAKLVDDQIREIRRRYSAGETQPSIAKDYGVNQGRISSIVRRHTWAHVAEEHGSAAQETKAYAAIQPTFAQMDLFQDVKDMQAVG